MRRASPSLSEVTRVLGHFASALKTEARRDTVCIEVSTMIVRVLQRFGYPASLLAVTALFCDVRNEQQLIRSTVGRGGSPKLLQRDFPVVALGAYNDAVLPVPGISGLAGMPIAAHVAVLVESPRTLLDLTADQLNKFGRVAVPAILEVAAPRAFPAKDRKLTARLGGLYIQYDWIESDQTQVPNLPHPTDAQVDRFETDIRAFVSGHA